MEKRPGVPHADPERFVNIWIGSAAFSALTWVNPYMWQLSNQFNWHDKAMCFEQYHWKKAMKKGSPTNLSGTSTWTRISEIPTISTGLFISLSCKLL
ncbi:hypothetical protein Prudu_017515 [Prunus dulcis]|uniref:Uncharacterized protein n=1 Tax=Prunus dulcis TaxID=3755 RepID=A0A4Y1RNR1_PRUDU|nr:hypothetical protein Prudu_017515 [Prunus dulcis]